MKSVINSLVIPLFLSVPMLRHIGSKGKEFKEAGAPGDSLRYDDNQKHSILTYFFNICRIHKKFDEAHEGLYRIVDNRGKMGFSDENGAIVIKPRFDYVRPFSENLAVFNIGGHFFYKNETYMYEGGKWGVINKKGETILSPVYDEITDCHDGQFDIRIGNVNFKLCDFKSNRDVKS